MSARQIQPPVSTHFIISSCTLAQKSLFFNSIQYSKPAFSFDWSVVLNANSTPNLPRSGLKSQQECSNCPAGKACKGGIESPVTCSAGHYCPEKTTSPTQVGTVRRRPTLVLVLVKTLSRERARHRPTELRFLSPCSSAKYKRMF